MNNSFHHLRNHLSKNQALKILAGENFNRVVVSFYRYVIIADPVKLRHELFAEWQALGCLGRIYLAEEGINAQMSIPEPQFEKFKEALYKHPHFEGVAFKVGIEQERDAFWKLTIKLKKQIVADGLTPEDYDVTNVGTHLSAREFNQALEEGAIVLDMRNNYESAIGRFEGAITPNAYTFREELPMAAELLKGKEDKDIIIYCTGGIRCEKASSYLKHKGFSKVHQLLGGIIEYKHQVEQEKLENKFRGKNFVFDDRMDERITDNVLGKCYQCKMPADDYVNCAEAACNLLFIQCKECKEKMEGFCSKDCLEGKFVAPVKHTEGQFRRSIAVSA